MLQFPITITLTRAERFLISYIGRLRQKENEVTGVEEYKVTDEDPEELHILGLAGEVVFCRVANLYPDLNTEPRSGGFDCTLPSSLTVDVKTTSRLDGNLITPKSKNKNTCQADIMVLVTGTLPMVGDTLKPDWTQEAIFTIHGWAWGRDLLHPHTLRILRQEQKNGEVKKTDTHFIDRGRLFTTLPLLSSENMTRDFPRIFKLEANEAFEDPTSVLLNDLGALEDPTQVALGAFEDPSLAELNL